MKKFYPIKISLTDNGIIVEAGYLKIVYQQDQLEMFFDHLELYLSEPGKAYKMIRERWNIVSEDQAEEATPSISEQERPTVRANIKESRKL